MSSYETWVATFDGQVGRVYGVDEQKRLRHLESEGRDARPNTDSQPDGLRVPHTAEVAGYITEPQFVESFAKHLDQRARAGAFQRLIISADPNALHYFRDAVPATLKTKVVKELNKDHVHTPVKAFESAISEHL
ncbi:MAG: host attachment protein [Proteobacteria bacterium]|nr:host attachment protein [Pseudomonadota bacterium]MBW3617324.1 host attachment protein [Pseudomonadota bacterium]